MLKIRISEDTFEKCTEAVKWFKKKFPTMTFTTPKLGNNPKYKDDQKWFSYGNPRQLKGKPRRVNFKNRK